MDLPHGKDSLAGSRERRRPLRRTLLTTLILVAGGLVLGAAVELTARYRESVAAIVVLHTEIAEGAALEVGRFVDEVETAMRVSAQSARAAAAGLSASFRLELLDLLKSAPAVTEAAALDRAGREVAKVSREALVIDDELGDQSASIAFLRAIAGETYVGRVTLVRHSEPFVTVAVPIAWLDGRIEGVVVADVRLKPLSDIVSGIAVGRGGTAYVVSDEGVLIAHPDVSLVLQQPEIGGLAQVRAALAGSPVPFWPRQGVAESGAVVAAHAPVGDLGWSVLVERPAGEVLVPLLASLARTFGMFVAAIAMVVAAAVVVNRRVLRPLAALREGARRIDEGAFDRRIDVATGDEFAAIARTFNAMAARWHDLHGSLEQHIDERTRELATAMLAAASDVRGAGGLPAAAATDGAATPGAAATGETTVLLERTLAEGSISDPRLVVALECSLCRAYIVAGRPHDAVRAYERASAGAEAFGDDPLAFYPHYLMATARRWPELLAVRLEAGRRAFSMIERRGRPARETARLASLHFADLVEAGNIVGARAVVGSAILRPAEGDQLLDATRLRMEAALAVQAGVDDSVESAIAAARDAGTAAGAADAAAVHDLQMFILRREQGRVGEFRSTAERLSSDRGEAAAWGPAQALIYRDLGMEQEARDAYERWASDGFAGIPRDDRRVVAAAHLSELCAYFGDAARALALYELLQPSVGHNLVTPAISLGAADRYLGMLAAARGDWTEADGHFQDAIAFDDRAGQPIWLGHARFDYAKALIARNVGAGHERAQELLGEALEAATALGLVRLRESCLALLSSKPSEGPLADGLSRGELRVLRLLASGATNKSIGEKLFLSPHTVANHVRNILAKTDSANRTEAANYARRHGLTADEQPAEPP